METIREYLLANDGQSLLGSLLQYGFDPQAIDVDERSGVIEIKDSLVYLIDEVRTMDELMALNIEELIKLKNKAVDGAIEASYETPEDIGYAEAVSNINKIKLAINLKSQTI